jgi:hypothetical protein
MACRKGLSAVMTGIAAMVTGYAVGFGKRRLFRRLETVLFVLALD